MGEIMRNRPKVNFSETDMKLAVNVLNKTRDMYCFFKYLKEKHGSNFAMVLIKSNTLKEFILEQKRASDVYIDMDMDDMHLIFLPVMKKDESNGFINRMISGIEENSGDFASVVEVKKNTDLEETVFTLLVNYLMILKQPVEWRTGQISYKEV